MDVVLDQIQQRQDQRQQHRALTRTTTSPSAPSDDDTILVYTSQTHIYCLLEQRRTVGQERGRGASTAIGARVCHEERCPVEARQKR